MNSQRIGSMAALMQEADQRRLKVTRIAANRLLELGRSAGNSSSPSASSSTRRA